MDNKKRRDQLRDFIGEANNKKVLQFIKGDPRFSVERSFIKHYQNNFNFLVKHKLMYTHESHEKYSGMINAARRSILEKTRP